MKPKKTEDVQIDTNKMTIILIKFKLNTKNNITEK